MKATTKLVHVIIWSTLTLAGFNLRGAKEPLYDELGSYSRKITTDSPEAQRYFNQGLAFIHGFNRSRLCRRDARSVEEVSEGLREQKKNDEEAKATKASFQRIWAKADLKITSSCLCQPAMN